MKSRLSVQPLQPRGGIQIYPTPSTAAQERRISLSLFQQCLLVRSRLSRDPTFARYLEKVVLSPLHNPRDPVNHLWDFFCLGISLCHLYNCVPGTPHLPMTVSTDVSMLDATPDSEGAKKHAIMTFAMHVRSLDPEWDHLMVTDIVNDRVSLDGFMKFLHVVDAMLDLLPEDVFGDQRNAPTIAVPESLNGGESLERVVVQQLLLSERIYMKDLERLQEYASILRHNVGHEIVDRLFPRLTQMVNFQRWFLIHVESIASDDDQPLGTLFVENEPGFAQVYESYCANIINAADLMLAEERRLQPFNHIIDVWEELPGLIVKPLHRIHSYPIILENLMKAISRDNPVLYTATEQGFLSMTRVTAQVNGGQRRTATTTTISNLQRRVQHWHDLSLAELGDLLLVDVLSVTTTGVASEYHVFLFKKVVACFSEVPEHPRADSHSRTDTPLILQDHVPLSDIIFAAPSVFSETNEYLLSISWAGNAGPAKLMLGFRNEDQLNQWHLSLSQLIDEMGNRPVPPSDDTYIVPELQIIEPELDPSKRAPSIQSYDTQNSADERIIAYYFNGFLSPTSHRDEPYSLRSADSLHGSEFTSILAAYDQGNTSSPASIISSPGSTHDPLGEQSPRRRNSSPGVDPDLSQYHKDISFMRSLLKVEHSAVEKAHLQGSGVVQTLDYMQEVLDRMGRTLRKGWLSDDQLAEASTLQQATRQTLVRLAKHTATLPSSLFITGVHIPRIDRAIALGGFADIFLGTYRGESVAVKRLRVTDDEKETVQSAIWKEALIWRQLRHAYIIEFIGVDRNTFGQTCLVSPWLPHGSVTSYMERQGPRNVDIDRLLLEIAEGAAYLHSEGIVHGDLRGSNILIDSGHHPRLADFGLGSFSDSTVGSQTSKGGGSVRWMAPELLQPHVVEFRRTFASDVWSYGCVCVELYTCAHPYHIIRHDVQVLLHVVNGGRPNRPSREDCPGHRMPYFLWDLAQKCWAIDPSHRPTSAELIASLRSSLEGVGGM